MYINWLFLQSLLSSWLYVTWNRIKIVHTITYNFDNITTTPLRPPSFEKWDKLGCKMAAGCTVNISLVVEFQRWWVLKSKLFAQESTCSKEILMPTSLNYLWSSVVGVLKVDYLDFPFHLKYLKYCLDSTTELILLGIKFPLQTNLRL